LLTRQRDGALLPVDVSAPSAHWMTARESGSKYQGQPPKYQNTTDEYQEYQEYQGQSRMALP
jgi:hypothetical protein